MVTRLEYVEALRRERAFADTYPESPEKVRRLADVDAELSKFDSAPARRGRPETA